MKKMKLDVDALNVESFRPTERQPGLRGTVRGNEPTVIGTCPCTYDITCGFTCGPIESCQLFC